MADQGFEVHQDSGISVRLPSGANFYVLTDVEAEYVNERVTRYLDDNHFTNISDFQDIDKMVVFELFMHRWSIWLSKQVDYWNGPVDETKLSQQINAYSTELRQLKKNLGIDKVNRDRQRGDDSTVAYLDKLRQRAKSFGITRDAQNAKSIELFQQLRSLLTFHDNADEIERRESGVSQDEIFDWLREVAFPEFENIDAHFRENQKTWIRQQ